jgi:uncharacterized protein
LGIIFKGNGGVRSGWRFAGFMVLTIALIFGLQGFIGPPIAGWLHVDNSSLNAQAFLLAEVFIFVSVVLATALSAWLERRRIDSYGLPVRDAFRGKFWEGIAAGVVMAGLVGVAMYTTGGFVISGFGLRGFEWIVQPLIWGLTMLLVGLAEEYWFRGYPLQALARGTGFWPAAIVSSLVFGGVHLTKPDENFIDIFNIIALGMILCLSVQRTGSLWLAAGFHASFDFMQFFVIGTRNGGARPVGTLLQASFPGPAWINGGPLGTEASYFMLPLLVVLLVYILWRYPQNRPLER